MLIKSGTYKEWLDWGASFPAGTSRDEPVTVKAFPGDTVTIQPIAGDDWVVRLIATEYVIFDGLIFDGVNVDFDAVKLTWVVD